MERYMLKHFVTPSMSIYAIPLEKYSIAKAGLKFLKKRNKPDPRKIQKKKQKNIINYEKSRK